MPKLVLDAMDVVAFQCLEAPFTVRHGIETIRNDAVLASECEPVFGMSIDELEALFVKYNVMDTTYEVPNLFE